MTTDENIMEEMLERATNPSRDTVDELGVQMFCMVAKSNVHKAQEIIVSKIRSRNVTESIRAIELLEECMSKCGTEFQDEVAKFRFLNDLIRMVSKKYQGAETPTAIKQRIMECLLLWTTEYPLKSKIREAYDNLNKEGEVEHGNTAGVVVAKKESTLGIDEEMLSKLINSGDPENFKRANLLIQYRVNQEARRTELRLQHKSELQEVENTVSLLDQMLDTYESDGGKEVEEGSETMNLIRELYMACKRHKPILQHLLGLVDQADEELTADTLETNDLLLTVMKRYKSAVVHPQSKEQSTPTNSATRPSPIANNNANLLAELLGDTDTPLAAAPPSATNSVVVSAATSTSTANTSSNTTQATSKTLEELNEIFGSLSKQETDCSLAENSSNAVFGNFELLEPVNVFGAIVEAKKSEGQVTEELSEKRAFRELREIDKLSAELFKQNLHATERVGHFKKDIEKVTLNDLARDKFKPVEACSKSNTRTKEQNGNTELLNKSNISLSSLDSEQGKVKVSEETSNEDDVMLATSISSTTVTSNCANAVELDEANAQSKEITVSSEIDSTKANAQLPFKHLSDITIDLDEVTPTTETRLLMDDDDMKITFNFTEDRPSRHVSVIVISVLNKSKMHVKDFQFDASVKKPSKIRLLPPTAMEMPPYKPFRPPAPINQVMLLLNPTGQDVDVTCIVGYKLGSDPDPIKESIVANKIPFVE